MATFDAGKIDAEYFADGLVTCGGDRETGEILREIKECTGVEIPEEVYMRTEDGDFCLNGEQFEALCHWMEVASEVFVIRQGREHLTEGVWTDSGGDCRKVETIGNAEYFCRIYDISRDQTGTCWEALVYRIEDSVPEFAEMFPTFNEAERYTKGCLDFFRKLKAANLPGASLEGASLEGAGLLD